MTAYRIYRYTPKELLYTHWEARKRKLASHKIIRAQHACTTKPAIQLKRQIRFSLSLSFTDLHITISSMIPERSARSTALTYSGSSGTESTPRTRALGLKHDNTRPTIPPISDIYPEHGSPRSVIGRWDPSRGCRKQRSR